MLQNQFDTAYRKAIQETPPGFSLEFLNDYFTLLPTGKIRVHWWKVMTSLVELMSRLAVAWIRKKQATEQWQSNKNIWPN